MNGNGKDPGAADDAGSADVWERALKNLQPESLVTMDTAASTAGDGGSATADDTGPVITMVPTSASEILPLLNEPVVDTDVLEAAERLLESGAIAQRVAPLLADAYRRIGRANEEIGVLRRELKWARGPRLTECQKRLATLHCTVLDDRQGALELLDAVLGRDPTDQESLSAFIELSEELERVDQAVKTLERLARFAKAPLGRLRVGTELAALHVKMGDSKRALREFDRLFQVQLGDSKAEAEALLEASRSLLHFAARDGAPPKLLASSLSAVVRFDPDPAVRRGAATRLARMYEAREGVDDASGIAAYRFLASEGDVAAQTKLGELSEQSGDATLVAEVLEYKAAKEPDASAAFKLRLRAADLRAPLLEPNAAVALWRAFAKKHGPTRDVNARLAALHERSKSWPELVAVLEQDAGIVMKPAESAAILARAGRIALERLKDEARALANFRRAQEVSPGEATSARGLEQLVRSGSHRLQAAAALEPLLGKEKPGPALLDVLEARFQLSSDASVRLRAVKQAFDLVSSGALQPEPKRLLEFFGKSLALVADADAALLPDLLARTREAAERASDTSRFADLLAEAALATSAKDGFVLSSAAGEALALAKQPARALELYERALTANPTSAPLVVAIDGLLAELGETPEQRLARVEAALERASAGPEQSDLMHVKASVLRDAGELAAAIEAWRELVAVDPAHPGAHEALLDAYSAQGDSGAVYEEIERALAHFTGAARNGLLLRLAQTLAKRGEIGEALQRYRELLDGGSVESATLDEIERLAEEMGDAEMLCRVLESRVDIAREPEQKLLFLERLGELKIERLGDERGAIESWRAGARLSERAPAARTHAVHLYERMVTNLPEDREASERLFSLYVDAGEWTRIPEVLGALLKRGPNGEPPRVDLLLSLEAKAVEVGAADEFLNLIEEAVWQLGGGSPDQARALLSAKARVLSGDPTRTEAAVEVYRSLVESYGNEQDAQALEALIAAMPDPAQRTELKRWVFEWRASRAAEPLPVLLAWAELEREAGDPERTAAVLGRLRPLVEGAAKTAADIELAGILSEQLGRHEDALAVVAPHLEAPKPPREAVDTALRALSDPLVRAAAAEKLEDAAGRASEGDARGLLERLLESTREMPELSASAERWFRRLLELSKADDSSALDVAVRACARVPESEEFWNTAISLARKLKRPEPVAQAFREALDGFLPPERAEPLGRKLAAFFDEWFGDTDELILLLSRVLRLAPRARWALDRVKLVLGSQSRFTELFELYDCVLGACEKDSERIDLLDEAAVAAKDLADDPERAIGYLEPLLSLRPEDARIEGTLERLLERQGRRRDLAALLRARAWKRTGPERAALLLRSADLYVATDAAEDALSLSETLLDEDLEADRAASILDAVIRIPVAPGATDGGARDREVRLRAAERLERFHAERGRAVESARAAERAIEFVVDPESRAARLASLVERHEALGETNAAFRKLALLVALDPSVARHRARLAGLSKRMANEEVFVTLLTKAAETSPPALALELLEEAAIAARDDLRDMGAAIDLYRRAFDLPGGPKDAWLRISGDLVELLDGAGRPLEQCDVLERIARAQPGTDERRRALARAAGIALRELGDGDRAARLYQAILDEDPDDREALDGRIEALEHAQNWAALAGALELRVQTEGSEKSRADRTRLARLHAERLGQPALAIDGWKQIRRDYGKDAASFEKLAELLETERSWPELTALVEEQIEATADGEAARQLSQKLGNIHLERTLDLSRALEAFVRASDWDLAVQTVKRAEDPRAQESLTQSLLQHAVAAHKSDASPSATAAALFALHGRAEQLEARGKPDRAVKLLERATSQRFSPEARRDLVRHTAAVYAGSLGDRARAVELWGEIIDEDADDAVAARCFDPLLGALSDLGRAEDRATLLETYASVRNRRGETAQAASHYADAGASWEELNDDTRALSAYGRGAELGGDASLQALARIHRRRGELEEAGACLERLFLRAAAPHQARWAVELSDVFSAMGRPERARTALERVLEGGHATPDVEDRLVTLYRARSEWDPLARLRVAQAAKEASTARRIELLREAAILLRDELKRPGDAVPLLEEARALGDGDATVESDLGYTWYVLGREEEAKRLFASRIEQYGTRRPRERAFVHWQYGRALLASGKGSEAIAELTLASEINPNHPEIAYELARCALSVGKLELAEQTYRMLLLALRSSASSTERAPSRAEVYLDLNDIASRRGDAARADDFLESAFHSALESEREARALEAALRGRGKAGLLARALEGRFKRATSTLGRIGVLVELAGLLGTVEDGGLPAFVRGKAEELASELASSTEEGAGAAAVELAKVYRKLGDAAALEAAARLLRTALGQRSAGSEALRLLSEVLERQERHEELAEVLRAEIDAADERGDPALVEMALRLAPALERLGRVEEAIRTYQRVLSRMPSHRDALEHVLRLSEQHAAAPADVAAVLGSLFELETGPRAAKLALHLHRILVALGKPEEGRQALAGGLVKCPDDPLLRRTLLDAHRLAGDFDAAFALLDQEIQARPTNGELHHQRAVLLESAGRMPEALAAYEKAHACSGKYGEVLATALARALDQGKTEDPVAGRVRLAELLEERGDFHEAQEQLARAVSERPDERTALLRLSKLATRNGDPDAACGALRRLADLGEPRTGTALAIASVFKRAGRLAEAREDLERAFAEDPDREVFRALREVYEAAKDDRRLSALLVRQADLSSGEERIQLWLDAARRMLEDPAAGDEPRTLLERICEQNPAELEAALLLGRLESKRGEGAHAKTVLERALAHPSRRSDLLSQACSVLASLHLADDEIVEAYEACKKAFELDKAVAKNAMLLGLLAVDLDHADVAATAFRAVVATQPQGSSRATLSATERSTAYYQLSMIAFRSGDAAKARLLATKAVAADPHNDAAGKLLDLLTVSQSAEAEA